MALFDNGLAAFRKRLARIPQAARKAAADLLKKAADDINETQRRLAPYEDGDLKEFIRNEPGRHDLERVILAGGPKTTKAVRSSEKGNASDYDYAVGIEFGTQHNSGQPFFWPGYRIEKKRLVRRVKRETGKAIKKAFENG